VNRWVEFKERSEKISKQKRNFNMMGISKIDNNQSLDKSSTWNVISGNLIVHVEAYNW
jgi:hypothetical protein